MDVCLRVLEESNKGGFDTYSVRNISHLTFRDCRVHFFSDNLSRNSCIHDVSNESGVSILATVVSYCCFSVSRHSK